jgi:hypothetical protein
MAVSVVAAAAALGVMRVTVVTETFVALRPLVALAAAVQVAAVAWVAAVLVYWAKGLTGQQAEAVVAAAQTLREI